MAEHFDTIGIIIAAVGLIIAIVALIWNAARWTERTGNRLSGVEDRIEKLEGKINDIPSQLREIIYSIIPFGRSNIQSVNSGSVVSQSPLTLSKKGVSIAEKLNAQSTVDALIDKVDVPR